MTQKLRTRLVLTTFALLLLLFTGCGNTKKVPSPTESETVPVDTATPDTEHSVSADTEPGTSDDTQQNTFDEGVDIIKLDGDFQPNVASEDIPITYGNYKPNEFIYSFAASSSPALIREEMMASTLSIDKDNFTLVRDQTDSLTGVTYKKTIQLNELDQHELDEFGWFCAHLSDDTIHRLDELCVSNGPTTLYDVYQDRYQRPYKLLVFQDKIWLLEANSNFGDRLSLLQDVASITEYVLVQ